MYSLLGCQYNNAYMLDTHYIHVSDHRHSNTPSNTRCIHTRYMYPTTDTPIHHHIHTTYTLHTCIRPPTLQYTIEYTLHTHWIHVSESPSVRYTTMSQHIHLKYTYRRLHLQIRTKCASDTCKYCVRFAYLARILSPLVFHLHCSSHIPVFTVYLPARP